MNSHQLVQVSKISEFIYLGTNLCCTTTPHVKVLLDLGIKADIDLEEDRQEQTPGVDTYLWLPVKDHFAPTQEQLDTGVAVIDSLVKNQKKVYVHCRNGHGRSPTLVAAYFIKQGMKVNDSIGLVKSKRSEVHMTEIQLNALELFRQRRKDSYF